MRNGNAMTLVANGIGIFRSYRTYEEWKLFCVFAGVMKIWRVLTVPMRNGNIVTSVKSLDEFYVLTVPMRNGNLLPDDHTWTETGFLPYLWGMETYNILVLLLTLLSSYRTYEEWKPGKPGTGKTLSAGSYRTYEEWKLPNPKINIRTATSSYRTYEEWKLAKTSRTSQGALPVLTVPMRNGNIPSWYTSSYTKLVLTVPMRNGNLRWL